jgi:hypothetical protein
MASIALRGAGILLIAGLPHLIAGCGSGKIAPVSGRITVDGQAVANLLVTFQPQGSKDNPIPGPGSYGKTDETGHYRLRLSDAGNQVGAMIGKHRVEIRAPLKANPKDPEGAQVAGKLTIPRGYNAESKLQFEVVAGGSTTADFDVKTR